MQHSQKVAQGRDDRVWGGGPSQQVFGGDHTDRAGLTFQLQIDGPDDAFIPRCARDPGGYRVGIGPRGGQTGEATGRPDGVANRLEAGTHDDETRGDDADVHLDDGDGQRVDIGPWERLKIVGRECGGRERNLHCGSVPVAGSGYTMRTSLAIVQPV